jgi:dTDP-4-amino-4,6-dideoxygalactose transaminase
MMQVPLMDPGAQYAAVRSELMQAVGHVIDSHDFTNGQAVRELEKDLAAYCGCAEAIGVSSGTDALLVALMALGVGPGDEVITTPFTFFATAGAIWRTGARPVFVDIQPDTFNIDPARIEAAVTGKTRAIIPVHLYGQMAEMDAIMDIARRRGLHVIEDAAQAIGATYKGRKACSIGDVGCLSFYPTKNLGAMGDAGMVLTNDPELAERIRLLRVHGQSSAYLHKWVGGNFRMDSLCAAGLSVMLPRLEEWTQSKIHHAALYGELLADCQAVKSPVIRPYNRSVYPLYVIRVPRREELRAFLRDNGVATGVYYPLSLHVQECFADLGYKQGDLPESEQASREVLALPIFPKITEEQIRYVVGKIKQFFT